jgi:hypothetical protein
MCHRRGEGRLRHRPQEGLRAGRSVSGEVCERRGRQAPDARCVQRARRRSRRIEGDKGKEMMATLGGYRLIQHPSHPAPYAMRKNPKKCALSPEMEGVHTCHFITISAKRGDFSRPLDGWQL